MQAAELFEQKIKPLEVARRLRVSRKSAYQLHHLWREGGAQALTSRGPSGSRCRLPADPARRIAERDDEAVTAWKEATWAEVKEPGRPAEAMSASKMKQGSPESRPGDEPGAGAGAPRS